MERYDVEVERAMMRGEDPNAHIRALTGKGEELTEEQFGDLLRAAYSTLLVSTREIEAGEGKP